MDRDVPGRRKGGRKGASDSKSVGGKCRIGVGCGLTETVWNGPGAAVPKQGTHFVFTGTTC